MKRDYKPFLYALYCASIMAMNILATKQIDIFGLTVTCGIFVSGFMFWSQDIVTEVYGTKESKKMVFTCYILSLIMTLLFQIAIFVPSSQFWDMQEAFASVLQTTLRITVASFIAYSIGSFVNVSILGKLKKLYPKSLFVRAVGSTIFGQLLDNGLFAFIAFLGVLPVNAIISMMIGGTLVEAITEVVLYPILKPTLKFFKNSCEVPVDSEAVV
jgi:uncharacterized integral membrane protein (TIGR00697 family)